MTRKRKILGACLVVLLAAGSVLAWQISHDAPCMAAPPLRAGAATMRAALHRCYGGPEVLKIETVEKPVPAADELLIKVRAAGVNPLDFHYLHGTPYVMRADSGFGVPKDPRMGVDFAGVVEAVGSGVRNFQVGDEVFGARNGAFGEYVVVGESRNVVKKPPNLSFEEAAGVPIAAITALQALRDHGGIQPGQRVLVNGASGGVGTFAVQIAKQLGAKVTGVCSTRNVAMVRALGADLVVDYKTQDFVTLPERYDVIVDTVGSRALSEYRRVLTEKGRYVMVGGPNDGQWIGPLSGALGAALYSPFVSQDFSMMLADMKPADLAWLRDQLAAGRLRTVIDRKYPFAEASSAVAYVEEGHSRGKVILTLD